MVDSSSLPSVSIIVPIYNAEKYIQQCLDSIQAQTYKNFEAILVDDGSPDKCGKICDDFSKKDHRFKVIHQKNGGVSSARQKGLERSSGEYTIHVDPDDWIDPTMLEELISKAETSNADMVICDYWIEDKLGVHYIQQNLISTPNAKDVINAILVENSLPGFLWNKLIRKNVCKEIDFSPKTLNISEDELFNVRVLSNNIKISYLPKAFYHYRKTNPSSLTTKKTIPTIISQMEVVKEYEKLLPPQNFNHFYSSKRNVIYSAFRLKQLHLLPNLYPEIHDQIIKEKTAWYFPYWRYIYWALKGHPKKAYYMYQINRIISGTIVKYILFKK